MLLSALLDGRRKSFAIRYSSFRQSPNLTVGCRICVWEYTGFTRQTVTTSKRIIGLGSGDFCGWATSLHLSALGHDVLVVDSLSRRNIDNELEADSLTPIRPMGARTKAAQEISGRSIEFFNFDGSKNYVRLFDLLMEYKPDAVIHFAEQRAAPYSMKSSFHKRDTVDNNFNATHNLLEAIMGSGLDTHVVHLGTMGVCGYGTAGMEIPEGYLKSDAGEQIEKNVL